MKTSSYGRTLGRLPAMTVALSEFMHNVVHVSRHDMNAVVNVVA
jgi:hypothetical protein